MGKKYRCELGKRNRSDSITKHYFARILGNCCLSFNTFNTVETSRVYMVGPEEQHDIMSLNTRTPKHRGAGVLFAHEWALKNTSKY
jgi:hypothetical protein